MQNVETGYPEKNIKICRESYGCRIYQKIKEWLALREICGECKYNKRDFSKPQNSGYAEFCCCNEDSDCYGIPTMYDDSCDDFEEKDD